MFHAFYGLTGLGGLPGLPGIIVSLILETHHIFLKNH